LDIIATIALALGASWCAGINLYATIFVLGAMSRWTGFDLPVELIVLENEWVLGIAGALYTVEFFADKIPGLDTAWDSIQTFVRIPAGAVLAAMAIGDVPLELELIAVLLGGTLAGTSHTAKATTRLAAHGTGTSPVVSPVASLTEDAAVIGTLAFVAAYPIIGIVAVVFMIAAAFVIMWSCWALAKKAIRNMTRFLNPPPAPMV